MREAFLVVGLSLALAGCQVEVAPPKVETCAYPLRPTLAALSSDSPDTNINVYSRSESKKIIAYFETAFTRTIDAEFVYLVFHPFRRSAILFFAKDGCIVDNAYGRAQALLSMLREALAAPI